MTKQQKNIAIIAAVVLVVGIVLFIVLRRKKTAATGPTASPLPGTPSGGGGTNNQNTPGAFPLGIGSRGDLVKTLQSKFNEVTNLLDDKGLNQYGLRRLTVDGVWGPKTDAAFQQITALAGQQLTSVASQTQFNAILSAANTYINYLNTLPDTNGN
jgi:hypothetical protein